jgi:molybdopterin converting factor small subunit
MGVRRFRRTDSNIQVAPKETEAMNRFSVLLFARLKELAEASAVDVDLAEGATIADLRRRLGDVRPKLGTLLPHCLFAVNDKYVGESFVPPANSEIACIPPVSGG